MQKLKSTSDADGIQGLEKMHRTINSTWNQSNLDLQREKAHQDKLFNVWNSLILDIAALEPQYSDLNNQYKSLDKTIRSQEQLLGAETQIQVVL